MLPSVVASELQESIRRFLKATFPMTTACFRREDGRTMLDDLLAEPGALFKGPYLTLGLPFRSAAKEEPLPFQHLDDLGFIPYRHQFRAFQRLCGPHPRSTLVATGTGSGKTECFAFPIFDHCAARRQPGVKAIIIYPMNALATDQARRFARAIHDRGSLRGRLSVGLYVGDREPTPQRTMTRDGVITCQETLREHPPDILLTNYKMLDFLLLRPRDQRLWRCNEPGRLRYLVVDELHTFDGAQGTDLACLLRRLGDRLSPDHALACVGTSATIGGETAKRDLLDYAGRIFAASFEEEALILEDRQSPEEFFAGGEMIFTSWPTDGAQQLIRPEGHESAEDYVRAQARLWFGEEAPALDAEDPAEALRARFDLGDRLRACAAFREVLTAAQRPADAAYLVAAWQNRFRIDPVQARRMLDSLLALASWARRPGAPGLEAQPPEAARPFVEVRGQLWLRELSRLVATVEPRPVLRFADDLTDLSKPLHLPAVHCRECHATGWVSVRRPEEGRLQSDLQTLYRAYFSRHPELSLLFPLEGAPPAEPKGLTGLVCAQCAQLRAPGKDAACPQCQSAAVVRVWEPDMRRAPSQGESQQLRSHHDCPYCGAREGLSLIGSRAASLASVLIGRLFASPYNDHRKLIAFSDSVQDAAHRAGFFGARTYSTLVRAAIARYLQVEGEGLPLAAAAAQMPRYWRRRLPDDTAFVGTFIAPNMAWLRDYDQLRTLGRLPPRSDLPQWVARRLTWEVLQGFGLRARIGRTLERTLTAAVGVDPVPLRESGGRLAMGLSEAIGPLRGISAERVFIYLQGILWRMRVQGAFYHPMLEGYIRARGKPYELYRTPYMPNYGGAARPPAFLTLGPVSASFEALHRQGRSWYLAWFNKTLASGDGVLATAEYRHAITLTVERLAKDGFLREQQVSGEPVWGLDPEQWFCTTAVAELKCGHCGHRLQTPQRETGAWQGTPCLRAACGGNYLPVSSAPNESIQAASRLHRLVPAEHTALLDSDTRHGIERSFIAGKAPWDINLLSATPTLEMGIDIGDLSAVLLCSVPPAQANYLQRIGRAGRRDGNALTLTVANAHKHDLYFYAEPLAMLDGEIRPPGVFLQATAVLERQLLAYCLDRWSASGIDESAIPGQLREALDGVEAEAGGCFPHTLLRFIAQHQADILPRFLAFFPDLAEESQAHLQAFLSGAPGGSSGIAHRLTNRLSQLVRERRERNTQINRLKTRLQQLKAQPQDEAITAEINAVEAERNALLALRRRMNGQPTLNFFTDEGILPNYAFPEEGVTLNSIIVRRLSQAEREGEQSGQRYERINFQIQRPAQAALGELAPFNRFYAVGRQVEIDQVDLTVSPIQEWRLCDRCHYTENLAESGDPHSVCPRCGSPQWADAGRKRTLLRLRQVFATADDRASRIGDDSDQRTPLFFNRQMLVDVPSGSAAQAFRLAAEHLPFGFEYLPRLKLREINFGPPEADTEEFAVAGEFASRPGFQLCRHCGKVRQDHRGPRAGFQHAYDCPLRRPGAAETDGDYFNSLYLFRELESEAVRILLPLAEVGASGKRLHSLIAALNLGLRRYFRGNVDHIQVAHHSAPTGGEVRKHYLVLFDTVPGGTGYLKELLRRPENLLSLLRRAYQVISRCGCRDDEHRDGCYRCLLAYRESRKMDQISRQAAEEILGKILDEAHRLEPVDSLGSIEINALLESELEQRFIDALHNTPGVTLSPQYFNDKPGFFLTLAAPEAQAAPAAAWKLEPQVSLGPAQGVAVPVRPDFVLWPVREAAGLVPVAVFVDGFQFHYDKLADDTVKRQALLDCGRFRVWSLGWHSLPFPGARPANPAEVLLAAGQQPTMQALFNKLAPTAGWRPHGEYGGLIGEGPFRWLLGYLGNNQDALERLSQAALSRALGWLNPSWVQDPAYRAAALNELRAHLPPYLAERLDDSRQEPLLLGGRLEASGIAAEGIRICTQLPRSAMERAARGDLGGLLGELSVHLAIDDLDSRQDKTFEARWAGFWGTANLLQFTPRLALFSASGVRQGRYAPPASRRPAAPSEAEDAQWQEVAAKSWFEERVWMLRDAGLPPPEVGIELLDAAGEVLPEIELFWRAAHVGVVESIAPEEARAFEQLGWRLYEGLNDTVVAQLAKEIIGNTKREELSS